MADKGAPDVRLRAAELPSTPSAPLRWTAEIQNSTSRTLFLSTRIQSLEPEPDGSALHVSTMRPALAEEIYVPVFRLETEPVEPGQQLETEFSVSLPLRLHRIEGFPPRTEVTEWMPAEQFEVRMRLAFGERPFYPPSSRSEMARALGEWGETVDLDPLTVVREPATGGGQRGVDQ